MSIDPTRSPFARRAFCRVFLALLCLGTLPCRGVVSSTGLPIQQVVGAERFYDNGFFGFNAIIANVEAGHVWDGHEVFTDPVGPGVYFVQDHSLDLTFPKRQYDAHATAVGGILTGIGAPVAGGYYYYQFGMSPGSALISSAIATSWTGNSGQFDISTQSFNSGYLIPMRDGVPIEIFGKGTGITLTLRADVVNSSWGFPDSGGAARETMTIDALIDKYRQTFCYSAGNHDGPNEPVVGPASGYNGIAVAALGTTTSSPVYGSIADFSNVGPNDFHSPRLNKDIPAIRAAVDIAAPGTDIVAAAYTGATGVNTGIPDPFPGQKDLYFFGTAGTSFSSPIVAGGAALMVDAGRVMLTSPHAVDALVIKANLLNSASKTAGWTNNTQSVGGVLRTTQGLDFAVGAGALNLDRAYDQYLSGDADLPGVFGGTIHALGWDFGNVSAGAPNDYTFQMSLTAGVPLTATLDWMIHRHFDEATGDSSEVFFNDLDLQLWRVKNGVPAQLIAESASLYNNVEHLFLTIPTDGQYALRVLFFSNTFDLAGNSPFAEDYALAWTVPEPVWLPVTFMIAFVMRRRDRFLV